MLVVMLSKMKVVMVNMIKLALVCWCLCGC